MKLFCDENVGTGIPNALKGVGYDAVALVDYGWSGKPDVWWLKKAGQNGWLVFSYNMRMLKVQKERDAILNEKVGVVFLTRGVEQPASVLLRLLKKWPDLELLDKTTPRPFARFLSGNNRFLTQFRDYRL